jgi:hypothetical protein
MAGTIRMIPIPIAGLVENDFHYQFLCVYAHSRIVVHLYYNTPVLQKRQKPKRFRDTNIP